MDVTKKTVEIENVLIRFVEKQAKKNKRSFTQELNKVLENEKNRVTNQERDNA
jgi:hypothetical protein